MILGPESLILRCHQGFTLVTQDFGLRFDRIFHTQPLQLLTYVLNNRKAVPFISRLLPKKVVLRTYMYIIPTIVMRFSLVMKAKFKLKQIVTKMKIMIDHGLSNVSSIFPVSYLSNNCVDIFCKYCLWTNRAICCTLFYW